MNLKKNPELIPLIDWWEKDGKSTVLYIAIALAAFGGWKYFQHYRASVKEAASNAVVSSLTTEELENAVAEFGSKDAGGALKLKLAKSYFDAGRYEESLAIYEELKENAPDGLGDIPAVGRAQALEALAKYDDALQAFDAYAEAAGTNGYLRLTAQLGGIRCLAEKGDKAGALKRLESLKATATEEGIAKSRIEATETLVKRYEPAKK